MPAIKTAAQASQSPWSAYASPATGGGSKKKSFNPGYDRWGMFTSDPNPSNLPPDLLANLDPNVPSARSSLPTAGIPTELWDKASAPGYNATDYAGLRGAYGDQAFKDAFLSGPGAVDVKQPMDLITNSLKGWSSKDINALAQPESGFQSSLDALYTPFRMVQGMTPTPLTTTINGKTETYGYRWGPFETNPILASSIGHNWYSPTGLSDYIPGGRTPKETEKPAAPIPGQGAIAAPNSGAAYQQEQNITSLPYRSGGSKAAENPAKSGFTYYSPGQTYDALGLITPNYFADVANSRAPSFNVPNTSWGLTQTKQGQQVQKAAPTMPTVLPAKSGSTGHSSNAGVWNGGYGGSGGWSGYSPTYQRGYNPIGHW